MIPTKNLCEDYRRFVDAWEIRRRGIFVPPNDRQSGVYVWSGKYICNETVVITANEYVSTVMAGADLYIGIAEEEARLRARQAGVSDSEFQAEAATHLAPGGLKSAIYLLNLIKGLPDGSFLELEAPPVLNHY
jgi:hypothetical protein